MSSNQSAVSTSDYSPFMGLASKEYLLRAVDRIQGFHGVRVVYFDGIKLHELRPHPPICQENAVTVLLKKVSPVEQVRIVNPAPRDKPKQDLFYQELLSSSLSCGAAALSWVAVAGSSAAIPVSGGASSVITVLAYGAAGVSSVQCINSAVRFYNETDFGSSEVNQWLDSQLWYTNTMTSLDAISVLGAAASMGATLRMVLNLRLSGASVSTALKGLPRNTRKRLTEDLIRAQNSGISNGALKALIAAGKYPKRFGRIEITNSVRLQLKDAFGASLSFSGSALGGVIREPSAVPKVAIAIFEEFETY